MIKRLMAVMFLLMAMSLAAQPVKTGPLVDLAPLLAPPPAQDSAQVKAELKELEEIQRDRTKEQEAYAEGDLDRSIFRFKDVMGDKFTPENLPLTAVLFKKAVAECAAAVKPVKALYDRPRPFTVDKGLKPCVEEDERGNSYPSGHATAGTAMAVLLAQMVPEKKAEIFARGWTFAVNRLVVGVHYRSDIEAGRIAGTVVADHLMGDPGFRKEFEAAKAEIRKVLGL